MKKWLGGFTYLEMQTEHVTILPPLQSNLLILFMEWDFCNTSSF